MKKVSICIPAYNNVSAIKRLCISILEQDYSEYEVIITDDSTEDDVERYIKEIQDKRFSYERNVIPLGATANCNAAIRKAKGEYIKVMHHDDWFSDSHSLRLMVNMLEQNADAVIAFSGTYQVSAKNRYARSITPEQENKLRCDADYLFIGNYIGAPSATIWRNQGVLFDDRIKWLVDVELYIRLLREKNIYAYTTEPLICIGISDTQVTESCLHDRELIMFENAYVYHKLSLKNKKMCTDALYKIMRKYKATNQELKKYGCSVVGYSLYGLMQRIRRRIVRRK